ncbi:DoxX family protein [Nocardia sp. NPDC050630]|uniref:DoxX family protein n=1 Tax=Nocardia sp. NPDC050630 TaxID=3364321 RepID=UPI0037940AE9
MFVAYVHHRRTRVGSAVVLRRRQTHQTAATRRPDARAAGPLGILPFLGAAQIAGALGLIIGIWFAPLAIAATIGVALYFVGAVGAHLRVGDNVGTLPAAVLVVVSGVLIGLRAAVL